MIIIIGNYRGDTELSRAILSAGTQHALIIVSETPTTTDTNISNFFVPLHAHSEPEEDPCPPVRWNDVHRVPRKLLPRFKAWKPITPRVIFQPCWRKGRWKSRT